MFRAELEGGEQLIGSLRALRRVLAQGVPKARKRAGKWKQGQIRQWFYSAGDGTWQPISEPARARRKKNTSGDPPLVDTEQMLDDFSTPRYLANGAVEFRTDKHGAKQHHEGGGTYNEPARPFAQFEDDEEGEIADIYTDEIGNVINDFF